MSLTFLRRKSLGAGSIKGMVGFIENIKPSDVSPILFSGDKVNVIRNDKLCTLSAKNFINNTDYLIRWGCTSYSGIPIEQQINTSDAIKEVNDKRGFRYKIKDTGLAPDTMFSLLDETNWDNPKVLRPINHSQGKNLWVVNNYTELEHMIKNKPILNNGWYAGELINKVAEYRVYVVSGRVATIARKIPDDYNDIAWNVAQGGVFEVVNWGDWDLNVCRNAVKSMELTSLDFGGVDVMVDDNGKAYLIEINSAPSLPLMNSGENTYRQRCMSKCFNYILNNGKEVMKIPKYDDSWKCFIHPAIFENAIF